MSKWGGRVKWAGVLLALSLALLAVGCEDLIYETPAFNNPHDPINAELENGDDALAVLFKTIAIGQPGAWDGVDPLILDPAGDAHIDEPGLDITAVYLAQDAMFAYWRMDLADNNPSYEGWMYRLRGGSPDATGGEARENDFEANVSPSTGSVVFFQRDEALEWQGTWYPDDYAAVGTYIEMKFPLHHIRFNPINIMGYVQRHIGDIDPDSTAWRTVQFDLPDSWVVVTFDSQGGSSVESQTVASGGTAAAPTPPEREGYAFAGWFDAAEGGTMWDFNTAVPGDITLYARWRREEYSIGESGPAGGFIFYDNPNWIADGWRYMEVWTEDEGRYQWETISTATAGTSVEIGAGYHNTYTYMSGAEHLAAEVCRLSIHGGYDDWFLPSRDELQEIWWNLVSDRSEENEGRGEPKPDAFEKFTFDYYWSSSEGDEQNAWYQSFHNGYQVFDLKSDTWLVRAVRAF